MTSVKIEATVEPWVDNGETEVDLPDNQDPDPDAEGENENKPSIEAETVFNATVTRVAGVVPETETTLTLKTTGSFLGSYAEVNVITGTIEGVTLENPYYVLASALKDGKEVELLTLTPPTAETETPSPSRVTRSDEEGGSAVVVLYRTGIYVICGPGESQGGTDSPGGGDNPGCGDNPGGGDNPDNPVTPEPFTLTLAVTAGQGVVSVSPNKSEFTEPTQVTLTATPANGYKFIGWYGEGSSKPVSTSSEYEFTIEATTTLSAKFEIEFVADATYTLSDGRTVTITALSSGNSGTVAEIDFGNGDKGYFITTDVVIGQEVNYYNNKNLKGKAQGTITF